MIHHIWRCILFKVYFHDLRSRVVRHVEAGHSRRATALHFDVSVRFVIKLMAKWQSEGTLQPSPMGRPKGSGKLAPYVDVLLETVQKIPDITMPDFAKVLWDTHCIKIDASSLSRLLIAQYSTAGYTVKKTLIASERDRTDVRKKRIVWAQRQKIMRLEP